MRKKKRINYGEVDACLKIWGSACRNEYQKDLGYKNKSILYSINKLGIKHFGTVKMLVDEIDR